MQHVRTPLCRPLLDKVAQRPERGWPARVPASTWGPRGRALYSGHACWVRREGLGLQDVACPQHEVGGEVAPTQGWGCPSEMRL